MSLPPAKFREVVFQLLFSFHFLESSEDCNLSFFMKEFKTTKKNVLMAFEKAKDVLRQKEELDRQISLVSSSYDITRIHLVELNILRLCLYEFSQEEPLDSRICISEGIRLAKKFSTTQSISFINGVLDHLFKNIPACI